MLQKNIDKLKRANRANQWTGFTHKMTPTKKEKLQRAERKFKGVVDFR